MIKPDCSGCRDCCLAISRSADAIRKSLRRNDRAGAEATFKQLRLQVDQLEADLKVKRRRCLYCGLFRRTDD